MTTFSWRFVTIAGFFVTALVVSNIIAVKLAEVGSIDPGAGTVTATDGETWAGDAIVLAAGTQPNFFGTPGADVTSFYAPGGCSF